MLRRLSLRAFRNYEEADFVPSSGVSVVSGPNGSGKSSLLEAIALLSAGRSFRGGQGRRMVREGTEEAVVHAEVAGGNGQVHRLGVARDGQGFTRLRRDGHTVRNLSELAALLPARVFHPGTVGLVEGPSEVRRRFLDWGLFHVEQFRFQEDWRTLRHALNQRNRWLKSDQGDEREFQAWSQQVAAASGRINELRRQYLSRLAEGLQALLGEFPEVPATRLRLQSGWRGETGEDLLEELEQLREMDLRRGFTGRGAHRAELQLLAPQGQVRDVFSRGQCKILGYLLLLAQVRDLVRHGNKRCLLLVDDLASELDRGHRDWMLRAFLELDQQVIFTALAPEQLPVSGVQAAMFHVEHGVLSRTE